MIRPHILEALFIMADGRRTVEREMFFDEFRAHSGGNGRDEDVVRVVGVTDGDARIQRFQHRHHLEMRVAFIERAQAALIEERARRILGDAMQELDVFYVVERSDEMVHIVEARHARRGVDGLEMVVDVGKELLLLDEAARDFHDGLPFLDEPLCCS